MNKNLNLSIDHDLITLIKQYAHEHNTNVSELTSEYFRKLVKPKEVEIKSSRIRAILDKPTVKGDFDYKKAYQEEIENKYL